MHRLIAAGLVLLCACTQAIAQDGPRYRLGYGRLVNNDFIGDFRDRWQTGSISSSRVWGRDWEGRPPATFGDLLELRLSAQLIGPDDLRNPAPADRPYANALSAGLHTHFTRGGLEFATGVDIVATGEQTGLTWLHDQLHDLLGQTQTSAATRAAAIGDGFHPTAVLEMGREYDLGGARMRPFLEGRAGVETLARAGVDVTIGSLTQGELLVREPITGQRYRTVRGNAEGHAFILGADVAAVEDSVFLPGGTQAAPTDTRTRVRAGWHWQTKRGGGFYGVTWLGKEFKGQPSGQVVGSLRLDYSF